MLSAAWRAQEGLAHGRVQHMSSAEYFQLSIVGRVRCEAAHVVNFLIMYEDMAAGRH